MRDSNSLSSRFWRLVGLLAVLTAPLAVLVGGCATRPPIGNVTAVQVALVPNGASPGSARIVDAAQLPVWSECLAKLKRIDRGQAFKMALEEGEYRLDIRDETGAHRLTLHNSQDLSDGSGTLYRSDCVYSLVK